MSLSIVAVLIFYAIPQFSHILLKHQLENRVSFILHSIKEAKLAAIKYNAEAFICRIDKESDNCAMKAHKGVKLWNHGWLVFIDSNNDRKQQSTDKIIKVIRLASNFCDISWNRGGYISYHQFGLLKGSRAGTFKIDCDNVTTQLVINWVGRVRRINKY